jgi:hypothetical protein
MPRRVECPLYIVLIFEVANGKNALYLHSAPRTANITA